MSEIIKDIKNGLKLAREKRKKIRKEMTKLGRLYDTIMMILAIPLLIFFLISVFSLGIFEIEFNFMMLIVIIILPFSFIESKITKNALKKYKAKIRETRLNFCMYCGEKLDSIQKFCPYCGRIFDESVSIIPQTTEFEKALQKEYEKTGYFLLEQKEIINQPSRKSMWKFLITLYIGMIIGFTILIGFISRDFSFIITFIIMFPILMSVFILFLGFMMNAMFIHSKFMISAQEIKLCIEKKPFFQIKWSDIEKMEIYRVRFHGYYIKINYQDPFTKKFEIISLEYCEYPKKKQKEIIKTLLYFSYNLRNKITILKTSVPIVDEVGKKDLYEQIYQFARAQCFIFHKTIQ